MVSILNLLSALTPYVNFAIAIIRDGGANGSYEISLSYNTIKIEFKRSGEGADQPFAQCKFEITGSSVKLMDAYASDPKDEKFLKDLLAAQSAEAPFVWNVQIDEPNYSSDVQRCLQKADTIAKAVYLLDSGDDYRPGYYTEIILATDGITLRQINRRNARSSDHKDDYFMRELEFFIPLTVKIPKRSGSLDGDVDNIGIMQVRLSDHSSPQNRTGGEIMRKKIEAMKQTLDRSAQ